MAGSASPRRLFVVFIVGAAGLGSGVALLTNILAGFSLPFALALVAGLVIGTLTLVLGRARPEDRGRVARTAAVGIVAGLAATGLYDATKTALSLLDPSPYDPFEAVRIFGLLLVGPDAGRHATYLAGTAFHALNGTSFGLAYAMLFAREGRTSWRYALFGGMAWGLFLETFQLTLYPGWLDIKLYDEFVRISALSHLVYGASLGVLTRIGLRRGQRPWGPASTLCVD